ncbi:MAG TPA: tRNA (adenosine(37)-N6)-threonylcarbamoyltransferase complex ATPase subunit type 1 TsaE [Acidimicrobiales bacterium]|nr:tRNA (adenosine(37)-N6)-threonylcarbamoyltransferase complex ATPase subunit type 1 TsaE [Acidimicrobiales bacterium]
MTGSSPSATGPDDTWTLTARTDGPAGTRALGAALAATLRPADVVLLVGGLGSGKTTLAQGLAAGLGVKGPVTSPTFTLVREYAVPPGHDGVDRLLHADLYRLDSTAEVAALGLAELVEEAAVAVVEWGDTAGPVLGDEPLSVALAAGPPAPPAADRGDETRAVTVTGRGSRWAGRRPEVAAALSEWTTGATR